MGRTGQRNPRREAVDKARQDIVLLLALKKQVAGLCVSKVKDPSSMEHRPDVREGGW